jgi:hypothetical protein
MPDLAGPHQIWARSAELARWPARAGAKSVRHLDRPIRTRSMAEHHHPRLMLHARERAVRARVLAGEMLTEVAGARRGWETAAARSSMTGVSAKAACRGQSTGVLRGRPCVYGDGDVDLG